MAVVMAGQATHRGWYVDTSSGDEAISNEMRVLGLLGTEQVSGTTRLAL